MEKVTTKRLALYTGRTHPDLAHEVASHLSIEIGHDNIVEVADGFGNGISVINQDRDHDRDALWDGSYIAKDNRIFNNLITHLGTHGRNGLVADHIRDWFHRDGNNKFDTNTYVMPRENTKSFGVETRFRTWQAARKRGFEPNGTLKIEQRKPTAVSCR